MLMFQLDCLEAVFVVVVVVIFVVFVVVVVLNVDVVVQATSKVDLMLHSMEVEFPGGVVVWYEQQPNSVELS